MKMNLEKQTFGLLGSLVILLALFAAESNAEFYWKNNKIVRQYELANDIIPKDTGILTAASSPVSTVTNVAKDAQVPISQASLDPLANIKFECTGKPTGPNKDPNYCDVYHVCVFGKQSKTHACEQMGERFYYDENLQRCEFSSNNRLACPNNNYFQPLRTQLAPLGRQYGQDMSQPSYGGSSGSSQQYPSTPSSQQYPSSGTSDTYGGSQYPSGGYPSGGSQYPSGGYPSGGSQYPSGGSAMQAVEPWKQYVRQNEQFSCQGKQDGFYPSKWCNVFYRCFYGIKTEFLCAVNNDGTRLWWTAHSTSQSVPQQSAQCAFPCQQKRQCTAPGGVLKEGPPPSDSPQEAQRILASCPANANYNPNPSGLPVPDYSNDQFRIPDTTNYCQGQPDGASVPNPNYCNVFHVCIAGVRKDQECAKGPGGQYDLWWSDATKRCEYPCNTQCSKGIYGSQASAQQVQAMDRAMNPALCGGGYPSGGSQYPSGGYPSPSYPSPSYPSPSYPSPSYPSPSYPSPSYPSPSYPSPSYPSPSYGGSQSMPSYSQPSYGGSPAQSYNSPATQQQYGNSGYGK